MHLLHVNLYINFKTAQESRPLYSDLDSFQAQQPSMHSLWPVVGLGLG